MAKRLIALCSIMAAAGLVRPGKPFEAASEDEGQNMLDRRFARLPSDAEVAEHWPEVAQAQAEAAAEKADADAKAAEDAAAAAAAPAEAKAKKAK